MRTKQGARVFKIAEDFKVKAINANQS